MRCAVRRSFGAEVGNGHAEGQRSGELDIKRHPHDGHHRGIDHQCHGARVVHGRMLEALHILVCLAKEVEQLDNEAGRPGADSSNRADHIRSRQRLVRQVEADHRELPLLVENDVGGLRIDHDVEFRGRAPVSDVVAAAHEHNFPDPGGDAWLLAHSERDVGERAGWNERYRPWLVAHDRVDDEVDGVTRIGDQRRRRQHRPVHPRLAVDGRRYFRLPNEWPMCAGGKRHARDPGDAGDGERVSHDLVNGLVAVDGRDGHEFDGRITVRENQRDRVIVAGVTVENYLSCHVRKAS